MSRRSGIRWKLLALASLAALGVTGLSASTGQAAFTTGQCQGANVNGEGASFARELHNISKTVFQNFFCAGPPFPQVTYNPTGSGAGRRACGERTGANADGSLSRSPVALDRFCMTDEPPKPAGVAQMNMGTDAVGDEGNIHVIPAGVGVVASVVNWPNNCNRSLLPDANLTIPAATPDPNNLRRVRLSRSQFEAIWKGDSSADNWQEVFAPALDSDADCNVDITRVVRFDDSGTSFAFKDFLDHLNPATDWIPTYVTGPDTRNWPNASLSADPGCPGSPTGPHGTHLVTGCANGNQNLIPKVVSTDGSIGYSDISTARGVGNMDIQPGGSADNDKFWMPVQDPNSAWQEPTSDPDGYRTDGNRGANCQNAVFQNVPANTFGDWESVSAADSVGAFGSCTFTYGLVFDDNAAAYGDSATEEQRARSVKDYWTSIVSAGNQNSITANDYSPLPANILAIAQAGVASIHWGGTGGGGGGGGAAGGGGTTAAGGGGGAAGGAGTPSNVFSIASAKVSKSGSPTVTVDLPGAGKLDVSGTANTSGAAKTISIGKTSLNVTKAGTYKVTLKLTSAAKRALKRKGKLKAKLTVKFTPAGGAASQTKRSLTLKGKRKHH